MKKLAIITTHPIQYYAPVFNLLYARGKVDIKVFYTWGPEAIDKYDPGFGRKVIWDIPLLEGHPHVWVENSAAKPGSHHFNGIVNSGLITRIDQYGPEAILIFGWAYNSHLKVLRHYKGRIPVFFRGDSTMLDQNFGIKSFLRKLMLTWVYRHIDLAFYTGLNNRNYFLTYGLKKNQLRFAGHAVDNAYFAKDRAEAAAAFRHCLDVPQDVILILFAGKLERKKDPLLLLDAFVQLNRQDIYLLFTGNGELEGELKSRSADHKNILFLDFQNQSVMPVVYQACDLFCLPSFGPGETWGLAVNEAMACGKPVIVSEKVGCARDLVSTGINGAVFRAGSSKDLYEKMNDLIMRGRSELRLMGQRSRERIKKFTLKQITTVIETATLNEG
jgi:glycosyltransferase involved in cell wall biosynthesis